MKQPQQDHPFLEHLPELYLRDKELIRLVEVLERPFLENEAEIDRLPETLYQPDKTPDSFLNFLGAMLGLPNEAAFFTPEQMRAILPFAHRIMRKKGTVYALKEIFRLYMRERCGKEQYPVVIEYEDWSRAGMPQEIILRCADWYRDEKSVTILIPPELPFQNPRERVRMEHLAALFCPAVVCPHVVFLSPFAQTDSTYLGFNSHL